MNLGKEKNRECKYLFKLPLTSFTFIMLGSIKIKMKSEKEFLYKFLVFFVSLYTPVGEDIFSFFDDIAGLYYGF